MNKNKKYYTIIGKLTVFVLLATITSPKAYSQAQGQRSSSEGREDNCQPHTNTKVDSPSTSTWANISAPIDSAIHHSELGALSNNSLYTSNNLIELQNQFPHAQDQRSHTNNKTDLFDSLRIKSIDSPSNYSWANISAPINSVINHSELGALQKFTSVKYEEIYTMVDAVVLIKDSSLKAEFVVNPGANMHHIMLTYNRARNTVIKNSEELVYDGEFRRFALYEPVTYQLIEGKNKIIDAYYDIDKDGIVSFDIDEFDRSLPLFIVPSVSEIAEFADFNAEYFNTQRGIKMASIE